MARRSKGSILNSVAAGVIGGALTLPGPVAMGSIEGIMQRYGASSGPVSPTFLANRSGQSATSDNWISLGNYYNDTLATAFTVTRSTSGFAKTGVGALTSFAPNVPRITDLGILIEEPRTNLQFQSRTMNAWTVSNFTVTQDAIAAPDTTVTADLLNEGAGVLLYRITENVILAAATTYTYSAFVKYAGRQWMRFGFASAALTGNVWFDTQNGVTGVNNAFTIGTLGAVKVEPYIDGFWRVSFTVTTAGAATTATQIASCSADGSTASLTGLNGPAFYCWETQCEAGAFATSPITTVAANASRSGDAVVAGTLLASQLALTSNSIIIRTGRAQPGVAGTLIDANGTVYLGKTAGDLATTALTSVLTSTDAIDFTIPNQIAIGESGAGRSLVGGSSIPVTDAVAVTPTGPFRIGSTGGTSAFFNGYIVRISVFASKLSNADLGGLTPQVLFESFDTLDGTTAGGQVLGTGAQVALNTTTKVQGTASADVTSDGTSGTASIGYQRTPATSYDPKALGVMGLSIDVADPTNMTGVGVSLFRGANAGVLPLQYIFMYPAGFVNNFAETEDFATNYPLFWNSAAGTLLRRVTHSGSAAASRRARFDGLYTGVKGLPQVHISFDDGYVSQLPFIDYLTARGMKCSMHVEYANLTGGGSGSVQRLTIAQVTNLVRTRLIQIFSQGDGIIPTDTATYPTIADAVNLWLTRRANFIANNWSDGKNIFHGSYPSIGGGTLPQAYFDAFAAAGFLSMRGGVTASTPTRWGLDARVMNRPSPGNNFNTTFANMKAFIDDVKKKGTFTDLHIHDGSVGGSAIGIKNDVAYATFDYLYDEQNKGNLEVVGYTDIYDRWKAGVRPTP